MGLCKLCYELFQNTSQTIINAALMKFKKLSISGDTREIE